MGEKIISRTHFDITLFFTGQGQFHVLVISKGKANSSASHLPTDMQTRLCDIGTELKARQGTSNENVSTSELNVRFIIE